MATFVLPITMHLSSHSEINHTADYQLNLEFSSSLLPTSKFCYALGIKNTLGLILQEWRQAFIISKELYAQIDVH